MATRKTLQQLDLLREKFEKQSQELWKEHQKLFAQAIEDSEKRRINLTFSATVDLSEADPILTSVLSWKDKTEESGMEVTKTFRSQAKRFNDDSNQGKLPGVGED